MTSLTSLTSLTRRPVGAVRPGRVRRPVLGRLPAVGVRRVGWGRHGRLLLAHADSVPSASLLNHASTSASARSRTSEGARLARSDIRASSAS